MQDCVWGWSIGKAARPAASDTFETESEQPNYQSELPSLHASCNIMQDFHRIREKYHYNKRLIVRRTVVYFFSPCKGKGLSEILYNCGVLRTVRPLVLCGSKAQDKVWLSQYTHMCAAEKAVQGCLQPNPSLVVVTEHYRTETAVI